MGLAKNKWVILGVEAPGRQGGKSQEYLDIPRFCTGSRTGDIGTHNGQRVLSGSALPVAVRETWMGTD